MKPLHLHFIKKSFAFDLRRHLCSQVVALQQGRTLSKLFVVGNDDISDGDQSGRAALHEEEGEVPETEGNLSAEDEVRGLQPRGAEPREPTRTSPTRGPG